MIAFANPVPLRLEEETGAIRVGKTRVLLEIVLGAFDDGATPEGIVESYSTLSLPDVYAVIAWYLRNREEADEYRRRRDKEAAEIRAKIEAKQGDLSALRMRIRSGRRREESSDASPGQ